MHKKVCLIGNPNVGKSSLFNILTHKNQHTGNWTGKTVENEVGEFVYKNVTWEIVDLPGTYSLIGESEEEKIASSFVLKGDYDVALVVADATNLERSLTLILEVLDVTKNVVVALNLMDEAKLKNIQIDVEKLKEFLDVPVIPTSMKNVQGLTLLCDTLNNERKPSQIKIVHQEKIKHYLDWILEKKDFSQGMALHYLRENHFGGNEKEEHILKFYQKYISRVEVILSYHAFGQDIMKEVIHRDNEKEKREDRFWNHILTNKKTCIPFFILLFFFLLFLTIYLSNFPSEWLFSFFEQLEPWLFKVLSFLPESILNPLLLGGYRTLYWVVSVMLPPMMIFFPLFAILEDYGLLPRIAFNLDKPFQKCGSCGKQSLTMCMGLGCNAVGVTGTRIMESKKMRILSILTNVFMPCNGRFPAMICMIQMFLVRDHSFFGSLWASCILLFIILFGVLLTFLVTKLLNFFLFKDEKPMFIMELPSFRRPKIWKTIKSAWKEKAFHVLKRAMVVSFPAGLLIYFLANIEVGGLTIFESIQNFLNPFGLSLGLDGAILLAFILGLPANEIVIPILLLGYARTGALTEYESLMSLKMILVGNGWTILTAINFLILSLCHFPCATTLLTIKKESGSILYTFLAFMIPTLIGIFLCFLMNLIF